MSGKLQILKSGGDGGRGGLFHTVEKLFTSLPLYGKRFSTVWKTSRQRTTRQGILLMGAALAVGLAAPAQGANHISENIQSWTARASYGSYSQAITAGTVSMTQCIVQPGAAASGVGTVGRIQMQGTSGIVLLPAVNTVGSVTVNLAAGGASRTVKLQKNVNGAGWVDVTTWTGIGTTGAARSHTLNDASANIALRLSSPSSALYVHDILVTDYVVTPAITLANNGTQVAAANVAAGTTAHVLHKFSLAVATANATLTAVAFTTAGTYATADLTNLKLRYSTDATLDAGDATLATITGPAAAGAKSFSSFSQTINSGSTGYLFITMDVAAAPTGGRTVSVNAIATGDLTFAAGTKSGSTTAGGTQTLQAASTPTITVGAGTLAFGNVQQNGTSSEQTYTVSGANLTANIVIAVPSGFEVSTTSGSGFGSSVTLTPSGGTVSSTTIYARFKPTAITAYSANITHASTGATTQNKAVTGTGIASSASDIVRDTGFTEPANIAYAAYQQADLTAAALQVGSFTIRDGGASADLDSVGTTLNAITFNVVNSANLRRIALYDGSTELGEVAGGATAAFTGLSVAAADGGTKTLTLRASFNAGVTDNQPVSFTVASAAAAAAGSGFAAANAGGAATDTTGDRNRIEVTATQLAFSSIPVAPVDVGAVFTATVQAQDVNNNLDLDSTASVTVSRGTGTGTVGGGGAQALAAGARTFSALTYDVAESFTLQATAAGLATGTSGSVSAKVDAPTALVATSAGVAQNNLTWTRNARANHVLVVRHTAAISGTPAGTYVVGGAFPGGGTVVYVGSGTSASDTGLAACTEYTYKAWSLAGSGPSYSAAGATASATTAVPAAPTGLSANPTNTTGFTANWTASAGASGYRFDVSTNVDFGGSGSTATNLWENFVGFTVSGGSTDRSGSLNSYLLTSGWAGAAIYENAGEAKLGASSTRGFITTPTLDLSGNGGNATLVFDSRRWSGDSTVLQVFHATDGTTFVQSGGDIALTDTMTAFTNDLTGGTASSKVRIYAKNASSHRYYLDNIVIRQAGGGAPDFVPGYSNLAVAGTSAVVTGLTDNTAYYFRVRGEGAGGCASANSSTASVTTLSGQAYIALADNGAQVAAGTVAAGAINHVLHRLQLTVTNAGATLTGVGFTSAGTYAAADVANFKVWYSADNTLETGADTQLGTVSSALGPGAKSLASLTQAIAAGNTGYLFITADIAAAPTYGNTLNVQAVGTGDLTFNGGVKMGSTVAGGAQTIVANEPTAHATGLSFTAVQQAQMTVQWTNGNGARRLVVARAGAATSWAPADGTAPAGVSSSFTGATDQGGGNKIVHDGTGSSFTLTSLTPGTEYFVTVFEYNGTGVYVNFYTNGTPLAGSQATLCPSAPATLWADPTNAANFTANWSAASGATGYRIDVSTNSSFAGGGGLTLIDEDFASFADWTDVGTTVDTDPTHYGAASPCRALGSGDVLTSPAVNYPTQLTFYVDSSSGGAGGKTTNFYSLDGTTWIPLGTTTVGTAGATVVQPLTVAPNLSGATGVMFRFSSSFNTWYLDDVQVAGGMGASFVPGYEDRAVAGTSVLVTGLTQNTTYSYRLRSEGASGCTGGNSATATVTTISSPIIGLSTNALDFGTIAQGGTAQLTLTVTNSGAFNVVVSSFALSGGCAGSYTVLPTNLTVAPNTASNVTVSFAPTANGACAATLTVNNNTPGNEAPTVALTGTGYDPGAIQAPTAATAAADGAEMVVLGWVKDSATPDVIVLRSENPITATALQGAMAYAVGDAGPAGTEVVYHGSATGGVELVVAPQSTHYYRLFGGAGTLYSTNYADPAGLPVETAAYETGEIIDAFAYTNGLALALAGGATGQGWSGGWTGDTGKYTVVDGSLAAGTSGFPDPRANRVEWADTSTNTVDSAVLLRKLGASRGGKIFAAVMLNYGNEGTEQYAGISLMSGVNADVEELFFGKVDTQIRAAGIRDAGAGTTTVASYDLVPGQDHMIVGELDPVQDTVRLWVYATNAMIPQDYTNASPVAVYSNASLSVAAITGIRLAAGSSATAGKALGTVKFDEVRAGETWDEALNFNFPKAYNYQLGTVVNGTNVLTDGELSETGKSYPVSFALYHRTGVTNAQYTIVTNLASTNGLYPTNIPLRLDPADALDRTRAFTNLVTARLAPAAVALGTYTSRVFMTAVSGKTTNTVSMEGQAGATDLFFGEFGEGQNWDKYVEIYNGTGGSIDLSQYLIAKQVYGPGDYPDYGEPWEDWCQLSPTSYLLPHAETIVILNYGPFDRIHADMTNALIALGRPYLLTSNNVLNVSGNDPVGLFKLGETNEWIDLCGIAPDAGSGERYIMRRMEDSDVPLFHPAVVDTNQWDYRDWSPGSVSDRTNNPPYTNFVATAGVYDRDVGLGGYMTFTVVDDDTSAPQLGTNSAVMIGAGEPYSELAKTNGATEVLVTGFSFTNNTGVAAALQPSIHGLLTNAAITWTPVYTNEMVDLDGGTKENSWFGAYDQIARGQLNMRSIGDAAYGFGTTAAWIQIEFDLIKAEELTLAWAEQGGSFTFHAAQAQWSADGTNFSGHALWPGWDPDTGGEWRTRYLEFAGVVPAGLTKVFIRFVLGPGVGGSSGYYRMDNIQLTGYPEEFIVTDGQLAASGSTLRFRGNLYDAGSGLAAAGSAMQIGAKSGIRNAAKAAGDGKGAQSSLWWDLPLTGPEITDFVVSSAAGNGLPISVNIADADADRPGDALALNGQFGQLRVVDDDTRRPKLELATMRPRSGILAQWKFSNEVSRLPTKADASVAVSELQALTTAGTASTPRFVTNAVGGGYAVQQSGWQKESKFWHAELTPEADMAITNISLQSRMSSTNGPTHFYIRHYVGGAMQAEWGPVYFTGSAGIPVATGTWYATSTNVAVPLAAGEEAQIRLHAYGCHSNYIGAMWAVYDLVFRQGAVGTNGITEVTDAELAGGGFQLSGAAWDEGSGLASPTHANATKRPVFSLNRPDGAGFVTSQPLVFSQAVADGGATNESTGAFANALPRPGYTNVMMGEYAGSIQAWDFDADRTDDDLPVTADIAMYVVDNDVTPPGTVGTVRVNGVAVPETMPDRWSAAWTNRSDFLVTFDSAAADPAGGVELSEKQRAATGIGEYRVAAGDVSGLSAQARAAAGTPYAVATTNGALANYGFEIPGAGWTLDANSSYRSLAVGGTNEVKEGTNSLRQVNGGVAQQTIEFRNLANAAPVVGVSGWYRSDTAGGPTVRIEAFATNDLATPVATRNIQPGTAAAWTVLTGAPAALGNGTVELLKISLIDGGGNTTFWDDLRLSVDIGTNLPAMRFVAGPGNQGLNPQSLFAVDADNNRAGDRLAGAASAFAIAYDITPPTAVTLPAGGTGASTLNVDDPTSQFDLTWSSAGVGPDDPGHAHHPTGLGSDRDLLSPWRSYKIYYAPYVALEEQPADYIVTNFIDTGVYTSWPSVTAGSPIADPSAAGTTNYNALSNLSQGSIRLYDLEFDQDYAVVVVGVDRAGNEGPAGASSWATNNTIKFSLTRGQMMSKAQIPAEMQAIALLGNTNASTAAALYWTASGTATTGSAPRVTKDYDLIYWDSPRFQERADNDWRLAGTVRTNWFVDDGGQSRERGEIRFYRASYKNRWKPTNAVGEAQRRLASEEVYALHNVVLSGGANYVALHGVPPSNTFAGVFGGLDSFPGGSSAMTMGGATVVEFFQPGTNASTSAQFYLNTAGRWMQVGGSDVTYVVQSNGFFTRGFSITLPNPLPTNYVSTVAMDHGQVGTNGLPIEIPAMVWSPLAQVPTNAFSQVIATGSRSGRTSQLVYNLAALRLPVSVHPGEMRLLESGFVNGPAGQSDEIYTIDTSTKGVLAGSTLYCDANGIWRFVANHGLVPAGYFKPNDVIMIVSRNGGLGNSWTWTYHPGHFYSLPTRWMEPAP